MTSFFRWQIANKVAPLISRNYVLNPGIIARFVKVGKQKGKYPQLYLPWKKITQLPVSSGNLSNPTDLLRLLRNQGLPTTEGFTDITLSESPVQLVFTVDRHIFSKIVLTDISSNDSDIHERSCLFQDSIKKNVVVECGVPSIGSIFNMTHFRSALHTNFVTNMCAYCGHQVSTVAQVEDSGMTAAALLAGYQKFGLSGELEEDPSRHLTEIFKAALLHYENDSEFKNKVKSLMTKIENEDPEVSSEWRHLKYSCLEQFQSIYKKIGVTFDDVDFDSSNVQDIRKTHADLLGKHFLEIFDDGKVQLNLSETKPIFQRNDLNPMDLVFSKSVFNITNRMKKHNFDELYHIAPSSQSEFLQWTFSLAKETGFKSFQNLHHIRLKDISHFEKKGQKQVAATDILKQATALMLKQLTVDLQLQADSSLEEMAESLAYAGICIHDLKHRRNINYAFDWSEVLSLSERSGAALQLFHAGLEGLQEDSPFNMEVDIDTSPLLEQEAHDLIQHLSRFDQIVSKSYLMLEPCVILEYLFTLWYLTNKAIAVLKLDKKHVKKTVFKARLLLLSSTLKVLKEGLHLLGLEPFVNKYFRSDL